VKAYYDAYCIVKDMHLEEMGVSTRQIAECRVSLADILYTYEVSIPTEDGHDEYEGVHIHYRHEEKPVAVICDPSRFFKAHQEFIESLQNLDIILGTDGD